MADDKDTSQGQNNDTQGSPKLIAGKYKTVEEAEAAIYEKDRTITRFGQENATLKKQAEQRNRSQQTVTQDGNDDDETLAHDLLTRPKAVLSAVVRQAKEAAAAQSTEMVSVALTIDRFISSKPNAQKHFNLFRSFLSQTDPEKHLSERLADAYSALEHEISAVAEAGKKNADAERKQTRKADAIVVDEGTGDTAKKKQDEEEIDTPESYMAERRNQVERLRAAL